MRDNLKQILENKRDDFEVYNLDKDDSWEAIKEGLQRQERSGNWVWMKVAASVVLVLGLAFTFAVFRGGSEVISSEFQETQFYYEQIINSQMTLVRNQVEDPSVLEDLDALDKAFNELSQDLKDDVHNEEVISAMVDNYRLKLRILEKILEELEDKEEDEKDMGI